ncbi:MAG: T9SS type A sorting domain-containing protein, partial [Calditrichaeota bacterium]|nr:T9SS type A sorting domain-containing protein [Calditrichota bacterium]
RAQKPDYALLRNYPNPFNASTQIEFTLPRAAPVSVRVFNLAGQKVAELVRGRRYSAGKHRLTFSAEALTSGVYVCVLEAGPWRKTSKMILLK